VSCAADRTQSVLNDLARRKSEFLDVNQGNKNEMSTILTRTPLSELIGYSSSLRSLASGQANFTMDLDGYDSTVSEQKQQLLQKSGQL
ncbi:unnamed protein product, partial [Didymodactylos carnosus]